MDTPTIAETHAARKIYVRGMEANYPSLDPRMSLLGLEDDGYAYRTKAYGNELASIPKRWVTVLRHSAEAAGYVTLLIAVFRLVS